MRTWKCKRLVINFQVKEAPAIQQIFSCASINVYGEKGEGRLAIGYSESIYNCVF